MTLSDQILDRVKARVAHHTWPVNHKAYNSEDDGFRVEHTHPCSCRRHGTRIAGVEGWHHINGGAWTVVVGWRYTCCGEVPR